MTVSEVDIFTIHSGWLKILTSSTIDTGIDIEEQINRLNISQNSDKITDIRTARKIHYDTIRLSGLDTFSITASEHVNPLTFGCYSLALWSGPDLQSLIYDASKYSMFLGTSIRIKVHENKENVELWLVDNELSCNDSTVSHIGVVFYLSVLLNMIKKATLSSHLSRLQIYLRNSIDDQLYADKLNEIFGCSIKNNSPIYMVSMPKSILKTKLYYHDKNIYHQNKSLLEFQLGQYKNQDLITKIYELLDGYTDLVDVSKEKISSSLHISTRTLNRRLVDSETSYQQVLDAYKFEKSLRLLNQSNFKISHIALQLGFADGSSFTRAFKRWSGGLCPVHWRNESL